MKQFNSKIVYSESTRGYCDWCKSFSEQLEKLIMRQNETKEYCKDCINVVRIRYGIVEDLKTVLAPNPFLPPPLKTQSKTQKQTEKARIAKQKITAEQAEDIKMRYKHPSIMELANEYNVSYSTIFNILHNRTKFRA